MPGYKVHILGGAITCVGIVALLSQYSVQPAPLVFAQWFAATILGSLFPDVDIKSKGQGIFYKVMLVCLFLLLLEKQVYLFVIMSFLALVPVLVRHRGLFHRVWFVVLLPFTVAVLAGSSFPVYSAVFLYHACFFSAGALSHIFLDRLA